MMTMMMMTLFSLGMFMFSNKFNKSMICFLIMFLMVIKYNIYSSNLWVGSLDWFYLDFYSFYLIILSLWLIGCIMMLYMSSFLLLMNFILLNILFFCFTSLNFMIFYILFEMSILPIFFMIMMGGYTFERLEAMMYMLMYTLVSSMPFLWVIIVLLKMGSFSLMMCFMIFYMIKLGGLKYLAIMLTLLVKIPLFMFHIWLPKAHVEAPVYGSMLLAGVMLKLGGYSVIRIIQIFMIDSMYYGWFVMMLSIFGGCLMSIICLIQIDLKILVAYSSVVHMSLMVGGIMSLFKSGVIGGVMIMIAHGLCSSGLFYLVNLNYECFGSRLMYINKGSLSINTGLGLFWFLFCSSNLSAPVSLNLVGEICLLISLMSWSLKFMMMLMFLCFFSAAYSLYLFSFSQHGNLNNLMINYKIIKLKDYLILMIHWIPLNLMFLALFLYS